MWLQVGLTADTMVSISAILDLAKREVIWTNMSLSRSPNWRGVANNVENAHKGMKGMVLIGKAMTDLPKPTLDKLFKLHARGGELVSTPETANTVFSVARGITPFDIDAIAARFLA